MVGSVIVAGSGPAGLSAALYLSEKGADVTVIDRFSDAGYSRYHAVCGAGISAGAFRELEYIEPSEVRNDIRSTELVFPGGVTVTMKVDGYVLDRVAFLKGLKARCESNGCRFVTDEIVRVSREGDGFTVRTRKGEYRSEFIIGCDGAHSAVRRDLFGSRPEMIPVDEFVVKGRTELVYRIILGERYAGLYEWSFPAGDDVSIGSGKGVLHPDECISRGARHIPIGGVPKISDGNAFICGDAAGMANPVSGGGIRAALVSAQKAAEEIVSGRKGSYQKWWNGSILSNPRFMGFHRTLCEWTDEDLAKASKHFKNGRNVYLWGFIAGLLHPKYIPMYIGCLMTFRHTW